MTKEERIARYRAAFAAVNGSAPPMTFERLRYRMRYSELGGVEIFTGPELDLATERLTARAKGDA